MILYRYILCLLLFSPTSFALDVLFVHSYHHDYGWVKSYYSAFKSKLRTDSLIDFEMDTKRLTEEQFQDQADKAMALIYQHNPKVVVLSDDNALKYVGQTALDAGYHVVFLGINANPRMYVDISPQLSGVLERPLLKTGVSEIIRIIPKVKKIRVLMDAGITSSAIVDTSFNNRMAQKFGWVQVDVSLAKNFEHWKSLVRESPKQGYDLLLTGNFAKLSNSQGDTVSVREVSQWTGGNSDLPVFSFWSYSIGKGLSIGGVVMSGEEQGYEAATIINSYLKHNEFMAPTIRRPQKGRYMFSRSELKRWHLKLPEDIELQAIWRD